MLVLLRIILTVGVLFWYSPLRAPSPWEKPGEARPAAAQDGPDGFGPVELRASRPRHPGLGDAARRGPGHGAAERRAVSAADRRTAQAGRLAPRGKARARARGPLYSGHAAAGRGNPVEFRAPRRLGGALPLSDRARADDAAAPGRGPHRSEQGDGLCEPGLARDPRRAPQRRSRPAPAGRKRRPYRARPHRAADRAPLRPAGRGDRQDRAAGYLPDARPCRAPDAAALERPALDGRAHQARRPRRRRKRALIVRAWELTATRRSAKP